MVGAAIFVTSSLVVCNSLQAPCHPETWRQSNKIKDLVDYLCLLGVKQRVVLHVNEKVDTLGA